MSGTTNAGATSPSCRDCGQLPACSSGEPLSGRCSKNSPAPDTCGRSLLGAGPVDMSNQQIPSGSECCAAEGVALYSRGITVIEHPSNTTGSCVIDHVHPFIKTQTVHLCKATRRITLPTMVKAATSIQLMARSTWTWERVRPQTLKSLVFPVLQYVHVTCHSAESHCCRNRCCIYRTQPP